MEDQITDEGLETIKLNFTNGGCSVDKEPERNVCLSYSESKREALRNRSTLISDEDDDDDTDVNRCKPLIDQQKDEE